MPDRNTIPLHSLVDLQPHYQPESAFYIAPRRKKSRWIVAPRQHAPITTSARGWWATGNEQTGDSPVQYHFKYTMAILTAAPALTAVPAIEIQANLQPADWPIPVIQFKTEDFIRRSMSLNGMRMCTEYFETGSQRIIQLVRQRLEANQRDIVHDVLVYVMQHITDIRTEALEARLLRAESVAAYLGLNQEKVNQIFISSRLTSTYVTHRIQSGVAGPIRRSIDVNNLINSQIKLLQPILRNWRKKEDHTLHLMDEIVGLLYKSR